MVQSILWVLCLFGLLLPGCAAGHESPAPGDPAAGRIGLEEKIGRVLPPGLVFRDESGTAVKLESLLGKPAILTLVYYTCEHICPLMLGGLAQALPRLVMTPGKDYRLITVSFDATDTPEIARDIKKNYTRAAGSLSAEGGWTFLVGDQANIDRLTRAVGFTYRKEVHGFNHPVVLIFLSPAGKISQYLGVTKYGYGADLPINFSSFDLNMGLTRADRGQEVTGVTKALLYCFSHEPPGQSKFFRFLSLVGLVTLAVMAAFFVYLQATTRRYRRGKGYDLDK
jgi:protein SCO1